MKKVYLVIKQYYFDKCNTTYAMAIANDEIQVFTNKEKALRHYEDLKRWAEDDQKTEDSITVMVSENTETKNIKEFVEIFRTNSMRIVRVIERPLI